MKVQIRHFRPPDADQLAVLCGQLGYAAKTLRIRVFAKRRFKGAALLVASDGKQLVGFVGVAVIPMIHDQNLLGRMTALVVREGVRGKGVGKKLVAAAETFARRQGCSRMEVTSGQRPEREVAHRFYEGQGYKDRPRRFVKAIK
jgi:GNAT superfamily N-acetyltransferase